MGRGRSKIGSGGGGGGKGAAQKANTPSGISYQQFMAMSDAQKYQTIDDIIDDSNIQVPSYLDGSDTTKVMYALGMNNKPTVVSDDELDKIAGQDLYRTVYQYDANQTFKSDDILDQIRNGDFTQLSGKGGSVHGRALYFAENNFGESASYGMGYHNPMVMRTKLKPNAKIVNERQLKTWMRNDPTYQNSKASSSHHDDIALYALAQGYDGWSDGSYTMIVNRGILTASSKNKSIFTTRNAQTKSGRMRKGARYASGWDFAADMN